jgi:hypothetical protein
MYMPPRQGQGSKDQNQLKLRNHKRRWSDGTSAFLSKLIAFKRGLNGRGDAKAALPPSSIKEPLPAEIGAFLDGMAGEFQRLVAEADAIINEQAAYSKTRRKGRPPGQQPQVQQQKPEQPNDKIVDTLSRVASDEQLVSEASNRITRLWQYTKGLFQSGNHNKLRLTMLSLSADLRRQFIDLENKVLVLNVPSIRNAIEAYQITEYKISELRNMLSYIVKLQGDQNAKQEIQNKPQVAVKPVPGNLVNPKRMTAEDIEKAMHILGMVGIGTPNQIMEINSKIQDYKDEDDKVYKQTILGTMRIEYQTLLKSIFNDVQKKYGPIQNIDAIIPAIENNIGKVASVEKIASNRLTRYLKRKLVQTLGYNKTSGIRLNIVEVIADTKVVINQLMDSLEDGLNVEEIAKQLQEIDKNLLKMKEPMSVLATMYKSHFLKTRKTNRKKKPQDMEGDQFMDFLLRRNIRRDISKGIL